MSLNLSEQSSFWLKKYNVMKHFKWKLPVDNYFYVYQLTIFKNQKKFAKPILFLILFILYRYLALESMCLLATSEFSHDAVKKHQETIINALKVRFSVKFYLVWFLFNFSNLIFMFIRLKEMWVSVNEPLTFCMPCVIKVMLKKL